MMKQSSLFGGRFFIILTVLTLLAGLVTLALAAVYGVQLLNSRNLAKATEPISAALLQSTSKPATAVPVTNITPLPTTNIATSKPAITFTPQPTATIPAVSPCVRPEKILVIVLDGMRPDAIRDSSRAPFILDLALHQGAFTWNGLTIDPSVTIPAHTSLLTGLDVPIHGVIRNDLYRVEGEYLESRSLFQMAKEYNLSTGLISGKKQLGYFLQPDALNIARVYKKADNLTVANYVIQVLAEDDPDLLLINFGYTDIVGHIEGWMSGPYMDAVEQADQAVRQVFESLDASGDLETTLVVILADHGGKGYGHSKNRPEDETIPWIISGPCVKKGFELQSKQRVRIFDTVPTILWALGWDTPDDLSGRVIKTAFEKLPPFEEASQP